MHDKAFKRSCSEIYNLGFLQTSSTRKFRASADDAMLIESTRKSNRMNFSSFLLASPWKLGEFQAPPEIWTTTNAGTAPGTRTSRRQRSWNELKLPLPWEGFFFRSKGFPQLEGWPVFFSGRAVWFLLFDNSRWFAVFFPNKTRKNREFFEVCKLGSLQRKIVSLWMLEEKKLLK